MVRLTNLLAQLKPIKALVVGDFMLDKYTMGKVERISPEAPVCVLNVKQETYQPGGAGNVALNLLSLFCEVNVLGRVGDDAAGKELIKWLNKYGAHTKYIYKQNHYPTPVKNRLIADNQQMVRIDYEEILPVDAAIEQEIIQSMDVILGSMDIVCLSDYKKGFLSDRLIKKLIEVCNQKKIPIIVDPKGIEFVKYANATMIKPNLGEAYAAAKLEKSASLEEVAKKILSNTNAKYLLITRSEKGMTLFSQDLIRYDFPVEIKEVVDVTGAGDTVLAMISMAIANNLTVDTACRLANICASMAVEHVGCRSITLPELSQRLLELDGGNKIFEDAHIYALGKVLEVTPYDLLCIDNTVEINAKTIQMIRSASVSKRPLLVYLGSTNPDEDLVSFLASLKEIEFVILYKKSLMELIDKTPPHQIFHIRNSDEIMLCDKISLSDIQMV